MPGISEKFKSVLHNIPGWHTNRKIVVFESDDWGSIRIPSRDAYNRLVNEGYRLEETPYSNDCLESESDITLLAEVLSEGKDSNGQVPVFTLNNIVANPDFDRIREAGFKEYHFEPFTETYRKYGEHTNSFRLLQEGTEWGVFRPQLHGREHLNVERWMKSLREHDPELHNLFALSMYGLPEYMFRDKKRSLQRAFDYDDPDDSKTSCAIIYDACNIFRDTWGFGSLSFVAPNFFWDNDLERCLADNGVRFIQGQRAQFLSDFRGGYTARHHYTGQRNRTGQVYLTRNCWFEPSFNPSKDWTGSCLKEISLAFSLKKPAVISTHRVNYSGTINSANRERGLYQLRNLIRKINNKWPDVEYVSTDQLGSMINKKEK